MANKTIYAINQFELKNDISIENTSVLNNKVEKKYKYLATLTLYFCSLAYGMTSYIIGPALNDMKIRLNTTVDNITIVFGCVLIGYTLGAVINGAIYNYLNRQLVLICLLFMMACTISLAPHCTSLGLLFGAAGVTGFGAGGFDTAQVCWIIELWAERSGPYLQGIQFFFALGTFISPLMTKPFLSNNTIDSKEPDVQTETITQSYKNSSNEQIISRSRIEIPFGIAGAVLLISALLLLILFFYKRYKPPIDQNQECVCKCPSRRKLVYIVLGFLTLAPYVGMEIMNFQLVSTFALYSHLKLTESDSATVLLVLAGSFTLARGLSIIISIMYSPEKMIFFNYVIIIIANIVIIFFEINQMPVWLLWTGNVILGVGFSSVFPAVYAFLERHITISNSMGAFFVCTSGLMAALLPTLCGQFIEKYPLTLIYINLICTLINCSAFLMFNIITKLRKRSFKVRKS